jgi:hypothetical protein
MIITKESEEFQNLLKKVEYLENVIRCSKYYAGCDPYKEESTIFKIGDWVVRTIGKASHGRGLGRVFKVHHIDGSVVYANDGTTHFSSSLRRASEVDIKLELINQANKMGFIGSYRFSLYGFATYTRKADCEYEYNPVEDALVVNVKEVGCPVAIYHQGTWATLVKEKKELPKTVDEFEKVLKDFANGFAATCYATERDKEVEFFLQINNYK